MFRGVGEFVVGIGSNPDPVSRPVGRVEAGHSGRWKRDARGRRLGGAGLWNGGRLQVPGGERQRRPLARERAGTRSPPVGRKVMWSG